MYYVGHDGHKDTSVFCITTNGGTVKETFTTSADPAGMDELIKKMKGKRFKVLAEASTYTIDLHDYLIKKGVDSYLAHPTNLKLITESCKKTDRNDAKTLADYLRLWDKHELEISISFIVRGEDRAFREICRQREIVSQEKGRTMQMITQYMRRNGIYLDEQFKDLSSKSAKLWLREKYGDDLVLINYLDLYAHYTNLGEDLDKDIERLYGDREDVKLLDSIPGVGITTAAQICSMIVDIDRFETADKMRSFFGMAPKVKDSGASVKHGHITRHGDPMMRSILGRTVSQLQRCASDDSIPRYYRSHKGSMKGGVLMVATENKLLNLIFAILKRKTPYEHR